MFGVPEEVKNTLLTTVNHKYNNHSNLQPVYSSSSKTSFAISWPDEKFGDEL